MSNESYAAITRTEFGRGATFRSAKKLIENWFILNKPLTCKPVSFTTDFFFNCGLDIWLLGPIKLGKNKWKQRLAGVLVTILLFLTWAESLTQKKRCTNYSTEHIFSCLLRGLHSTLGSPKNPSGHLHSGSCPTTLQKALMAQGSSKMQGSMHCLFLQLL